MPKLTGKHIGQGGRRGPLLVRVWTRDGIPTWIESVDVQKAGLTPGWLVLTSDRASAKRFASPGEVFALRQEVLAREPQRQDGKPNRPFSAFTIMLEPEGKGNHD